MFEKRAGQVFYHPNPPKNGTDEVGRACVYAPAEPTARVLYLLHGVGDNEYSWEIQGRLSSIVEDVADLVGEPPPLVVMPFGFVTQQNKIARRFPELEEFDAWMRPFIDKVELAYRSKGVLTDDTSDRAIAGLSMGGKQALEFGLSHPDLFGTVGAFSAAVQDRGQGSAVAGIGSLARAAAPRPRLYGSCGTADQIDGLVPANRELLRELATHEIAPEFTWMSGGHEWPVWRQSLEEFLRLWLRRPVEVNAAQVRRIRTLEPLPARSALELVAAFAQSGRYPVIQEHRWPERVAPHYHRTDEDVQVTRGSMRFIDVRNGPLEAMELKAGKRMLIPEGTVHAVDIGPEGVEYVMGLAHQIPIQEFPAFLPVTPGAPLAELVELVEANYRFSEAEEAGGDSADYFDRLLAPQFVFVGARAKQSTDKATFITGLKDRKNAGRRAHGLRLQPEGAAIAATLVVTTGDHAEYLNTRLFEKDTVGKWVCVRWANSPSTT